MPETNQIIGETLVPRNRVAEEVIQIVAEYFQRPVEEIQESQDLFNDLGADSLDIIELTMEIEEHFEITVPDEKTDDMRTVHDIIDGICRLLKSEC